MDITYVMSLHLTTNITDKITAFIISYVIMNEHVYFCSLSLISKKSDTFT
jgi:hypothetical protein